VFVSALSTALTLVFNERRYKTEWRKMQHVI